MRNVQLQGIHRQKLYASFEQSSQHCRCTINNPDACVVTKGIKPSYNKVIELSCIIWVK